MLNRLCRSKYYFYLIVMHAETDILEKNINPSVKNIKRLLETQICHADQPPAATTEQQTPGIGEKTKEFIRTGDYFLSP